MPKAKPNRVAHFRDPIYKIQYHVYHAPESRLVDACKRDGQTIEVHHGAGRSVNYVAPGYGQMVVHLWFDPDYAITSPFGASCIAHECVHAANAVFERIGAKSTVAWHEDEPYAYYVEYLVREIHAALS